MYLKTHPLRNAIAIALVASCSAPAFAQTATDGTTNLDRIEITGSRIRQASVESAQPVVALNRAEIEKKGYVNVADILQDVTAAGAPAMSRANSLESGRDFGGMYVSLRNLGPERSLVLIDGRRMGVSAAGYSDLASIPSSIVDRVEVLTDGASALYGSDAIAGVVNIITRKKFEGVEVHTYYGEYSRGGETTEASLTLGGGGERFSGVFSASYYEQKRISAADWEQSAWPEPGAGLAAGRALADRGNRVVTLDLLGHGRSDRPPDMWRYSMTTFGAEVIALPETVTWICWKYTSPFWGSATLRIRMPSPALKALFAVTTADPLLVSNTSHCS